MFTTRTWIFLGILAYSAVLLLGVSVGIRWHGYRAQAAKYARQEVEHTLGAASFASAASNPGYSADAPTKAINYRKVANMHAKAARESARLREFYERCW